MKKKLTVEQKEFLKLGADLLNKKKGRVAGKYKLAEA